MLGIILKIILRKNVIKVVEIRFTTLRKDTKKLFEGIMDKVLRDLIKTKISQSKEDP